MEHILENNVGSKGIISKNVGSSREQGMLQLPGASNSGEPSQGRGRALPEGVAVWGAPLTGAVAFG